MEGCFTFQWGFGVASFLSEAGGAPWRGISFDGGCFRKNCRMGGAHTPPPHALPTMGNPVRTWNF